MANETRIPAGRAAAQHGSGSRAPGPRSPALARTIESGLEQPFARPLSDRPVTTVPSGLVPSRSTLIGRHIRLEPLDPALHAAELYPAGHRSAEALRIWDYLPHGPYPDRQAFTAHLRNQAAELDRISFVLRPNTTGTASGMASYMDIQPQAGVIEIGGIWFAPELQRTRAATEALFLLLAHAMDDLRYRRMQWRCNALNLKSRNAARRLGFRFEGVFYNHQIVKGRNRDTAWYSILDDEWPEIRALIRGWLADDNFDDVLKPRRSLGEMMQHRFPSRREAAENS
jgi:RimJ/RimL family protein N-acetyltransferase